MHKDRNLILVVDDSQFNLKVLSGILEEQSYDVALASDGDKALEFVEKTLPDLILLDVVMPGLDGFEVCRRLKQNPRTEETPVIFVSAVDAMDEKVKGFEAGGVDFISKPFQEREILARIKTHLELVNNKRRIEELSQEYKTIINNTMDGIFLLDVENGSFRYRLLNPVEEELKGLKTEEVRGKTPQELLGDEAGFRVVANCVRCCEAKEPISFEEQLDLPGGARVYLTKLSPVVVDGKVIQIVGFSRDITEIKEREAEIRYISYHDTLTGLYNRAFYEEELERVDVARQLPLSIILGDVNGLKSANDLFGHKTGDSLLIEIARILQSCVRQEDVVARWGGDEFGIILPRTTGERARGIMAAIEAECEKSNFGPVPPRIALGVATKAKAEQTVQSILQEAERRMYERKRELKSLAGFAGHNT